MANRIFDITDIAGAIAVLNVCDTIPNAVSSSNASIEIAEGAGVGSGTENKGPGNNVTQKVLAYVTPELAFTDWDNDSNSGDWIVRLNVTTAKSGVTWTRCHICERTSGGSYIAVASINAVNISVATTGVKVLTFAQPTDYTASSNSRVYIILTFISINLMGNSRFVCTKDQVIDSPFTAPAAGSVIPIFDATYRQMM